ncbi:hypothetical protein [uncultured Phascolarctobacterium sp.]|uniref:hypothetical protein n=1 Tax=uncultured Phascolarctobacterium sp. TaxID=512296 RepID=UPI0025E83051|nr:hypothetical protein [uncultured Phascolarctobacterium sp.]
MKMQIKPVKIKHEPLLEMARLAKGERERTLFLHYTWGRWGEVFDEFHLCIDKAGEIYRPRLHLLDNIPDWGFLSGDIHIALCCGKDLRYTNSGLLFDSKRRIICGDYPTELQIAQLALVVAILSRGLAQEICYRTVKTMYEQHMAQLYFTGRDDFSRDLMWLPARENSRELDFGGVCVRKRAQAYMQNFIERKLLAPRALPAAVQSLFA